MLVVTFNLKIVDVILLEACFWELFFVLLVYFKSIIIDEVSQLSHA